MNWNGQARGASRCSKSSGACARASWTRTQREWHSPSGRAARPSDVPCAGSRRLCVTWAQPVQSGGRTPAGRLLLPPRHKRLLPPECSSRERLRALCCGCGTATLLFAISCRRSGGEALTTAAGALAVGVLEHKLGPGVESASETGDSEEPMEAGTHLSRSLTKSMRVPTTCIRALLSTSIFTPPGPVTSSSNLPFSSADGVDDTGVSGSVGTQQALCACGAGQLATSASTCHTHRHRTWSRRGRCSPVS